MLQANLPFVLVVARFGLDLPDTTLGEQFAHQSFPLRGIRCATMGRKIKRFPDRQEHSFRAS